MYKYKDQKEMRMAINGRMISLIAGVMTGTTALFTTVRYAMSAFQIASQAAGGNQDLLAQMEEVGASIGYMRVLGVAMILAAIVEVFAAFMGIRLCNRLDKAAVLMKTAIALLVVEVIVQLIGLKAGVFMLNNLIMPCCLLWSSWQLKKLFKIYPDRKFAVEPNVRNKKKKEEPAQKKSIAERAKLQAKEEVSAEEENAEENIEQ